ncbi:MAG: putative glycoside hydrolase [Actinomycetota bacterium]
MLLRRPVLERHGIQNVLVVAALGITVFMLAPPFSPMWAEESFLPFLARKDPPAISNLTIGPLPEDFEAKRRRAPMKVKGILMTGYTAGGSRFNELLELLRRTELNTVVVDIKDERGEISWIPRSRQARMAAAGLPKIVDPAATIRRLKRAGVYVIGRLVTFQDSYLTRVRPDLAIQDLRGGIWKSTKGLGWLDPYSIQAQDYNIALALEAIELGFDEIQFDYVRFPTDGDTTKMWSRYKDERAPHDAIRQFLARAREQIVPRGAYISADLFGLVALVIDDLGIGQKLELIAREVDYVSLMLYPSHYNKPEYGIADPEKEPYNTVSVSLRDAKERIAGTRAKLRPWLQDFTLRVPYTPAEVRAQIQAVEDAGVNEWILWNARNRYTEDALRPAPGAKLPPPEADDSLVSR